ncbi:MAG: low affinity iron permease family protein [Bacteroidetes bacterium]|nr:low affinity iron permease family protein [Bacteroidota bacterium]MBK9671645.1 low affinity iron permease family protein [Bacteroidota bacterium]MBK9800536.1 low affinity iron permease family protein [Bacteroidota bacterium]MBP6412128.1 low affinity iron permease family protein [Bacteroidia bacterium]
MQHLKKISHQTERIFEKITSAAISIMGNSLIFILALALTLFWFSQKEFFDLTLHESIRDVIHGFIFLSLFLIQKSFNRFSAALHLKVNELVSSHESASNDVINTEEKTERELTQLSKEYIDLIENKIDSKDSENS